MEKCYKLYGYPGRTTFKGACNAWGEQGDKAKYATNFVLPRLNQEQSKQLLQCLTNLTGEGNHKQMNYETVASTAHMAGVTYALNIVNSFCVLNQGVWIIDNGASEHMCSEQSLLQKLSMLKYPILVSLPNGT